MSKKVCLVLDNGGCTAKVGFSNGSPKVIPNCVMKVKSERRRHFVGDQIDKCRDPAGVFYMLPYQRGYLLNWATQKASWDYIFGKDCLPSPIKYKETPFIITEPLFNFAYIQEGMQRVLFGEYGFHSLLTKNPTDLCDYNYRKNNGNPLCTIVVDAGYSFVHVVPYVRGKKVMEGIVRIDVGGKLLTNQLKEVISYRQLNVMDETYVMNQVKEDACFVSKDIIRDMEIAAKYGPENTIKKEYVLPDYVNHRRGFLRDPKLKREAAETKNDATQQCLLLNNERFTVPELLFNPSDIGIQQVGVAEAILHSLKSCKKEHWSYMLSNVVVVGGCALFPGFKDRLYDELRSIVLDYLPIKIYIPDDPVSYAWHGGALLAQDPEIYSQFVPFQDYNDE